MADQPFKSNSTGSSTPQKTGGQSNQEMSSAQRPSQQYAGSNPSGSPSAGSSPSSTSPVSSQGIADKALSAGRDLKSKATDIASSSADAIKSQASDLVGAAKNAASQAGERLQKEVDTRKGAGAQYVGNLANTLRRAAGEFDSDLPIAATYIRMAASQVETVSDSIQNGNLNDLVRGAQSFARRQPTAFLGLAVLAGFGAIRFLKSSASSDDDGGSETTENAYGNRNSSGSSAGKNRYAANTDNRGYRDEFTK